MKISPNGRYLVNDDGEPFFYLADTAWNLFYHLSLDEVEVYLRNRVEKGFTVIMPCLVREKGIAAAVTKNGDCPFHANDPSRPNEAFFAHVDAVLEQAELLGLWFALLPTWGEYVTQRWGTGPEIFTRENARSYGVFLGRRYAGRNIIWVIGGDRNPESEKDLSIWRAMVDGIKSGGGGRHLMTYHPTAVFSSSKWLHNEPWLDFNMMQTTTYWDYPNNLNILQDYNREPARPTVDGEARYENSHEVFRIDPFPAGRKVTPHQVRKAAYNAMCSGAMGHTYGCRDLWDFYVPGVGPLERDVDTHWREAMDFAGAFQMGLLRTVFTDYPWHRLVPDQEGKVVTWGSYQQKKTPYTPASLSIDRDFAVVYLPESMAIQVDPGCLKNLPVRAQWFNPRTGQYIFAGEYSSPERLRFMPPRDSEPDFVLVIEVM